MSLIRNNPFLIFNRYQFPFSLCLKNFKIIKTNLPNLANLDIFYFLSCSFPAFSDDTISTLDSQQATAQSLTTSKKNSSRRNAWGNLSYADLITHAIGSATDKRLTLSQIYEWMVQNVPYFKDKGDSNSSAGWKVSNFCECHCY